MKQIVTPAIVLARTNYQEADRILTLLTPEEGKVVGIAKGVRRPKSKLAGGIELFGVNDITYIAGKSDIKTIVSTRLQTHYGNIVKDMSRTMYGYEILKGVHKMTEDGAGGEYFLVVQAALAGLDNLKLDLNLVKLWFDMQLLTVSGHMPNLRTDSANEALRVDGTYHIDSEAMEFVPHDTGQFDARHIKLLRLASQLNQPMPLGSITQASELAASLQPPVHDMVRRSLSLA